MSGKYVDNGSDKLIIVFQSAGRVPQEAIISYLNKEVTDEDIGRYHEKYNWFNWTKKIEEADFYYIEDHYSGIYGWYISDFGKNIINDIQKEIKSIVSKKNYQMVISFGSSKGGTGALVHGLLSPYISKIFSLVPQIKITKYINKHLSMLKPLIYAENQDNINESTMNDINNFIHPLNITRKKTIFFYTGVADEQFKETKLFSEKIVNYGVSSTLIINVEKKKHSPMVMDNVEFIENLLKNILSNKRTKDKNLFELEPKTFLYLGK